MATYFHGNNNNTPEIQSSAEGLQTLYLMNPNYVPLSDSAQNPTTQQHNNNMLLLNPNNTTSTASASATRHHAHALNLASLSHAPPHQQHHHLPGVTIPASNIVGPVSAEEISGFHGFSMAAGAPRVHYNLWGSINDRTPLSAATGVTVAAIASSSNSGIAATVASSAAAEIGFHMPGGHHHQQGLSLSLSSQHPGYRSFSGEMDAVSPASCGGNNNNNNNNGVSSMHSVVLGSKYLKAAQELLDEVANVGNNNIKGISIIEGSSSNKEKMKGNIIVESSSGVGDGSSGGGENRNSGGNNNKQGGELSTAQRQELQMKKSNLVKMLDEVDQRYREYHHQIQLVISSFEQAAGYGSARSYTFLALKTISKQFRCLKDAISSQIRATSKSLGEDDNNSLGAKAEGSRLRFVDHHLRQQRALQQLGMMHHQNNAWRPQRGLPERAVSILRAWLFEHFLHPYPKDSDKVMLAKQTGLTRSQVSNWFINARVRLWKPMVEEMYMEEVRDNNNQDQNNNSTTSQDDNNNNIAAAAAAHEPSGSIGVGANIRLDQLNNVLQSKPESFFNQNTTSPTDHISDSNNNNNSMSTSPNMGGGHSGNFISVDMEIMNKPNNREEANNTKFGIIERNPGAGGVYGALLFSMEDIGRFNHHHQHQQQQLGPRFHGNGVSLTLGLPPSENNNNNLQHGGFLSSSSQNSMHHLGGNNNENNDQFCAMNSTTTTTTPPSSHHHSGTSYDNNNIDMIQNRKRFAAQLLRDFVA